jgi:hypothetical protein
MNVLRVLGNRSGVLLRVQRMSGQFCCLVIVVRRKIGELVAP